MPKIKNTPEEIYIEKFETEKVKKILNEYGVCVVENHFKEKAETWKKELIDWLVGLNPELEKDWITHNMPYGPKKGMMQSLVSHAPTVWKIREECYPLFKELWNDEELLTSLDGSTIFPPVKTAMPDWPHIDQTDPTLDCIQGQVVLNESSACFRCTPKSHKDHEEILELTGAKENKRNWLKFTTEQVKTLRKKYEHWQVKVLAPAGSVIFWKSNLIHSAKSNDKNEKNWRCVVYVCQRPKKHFKEEDIETVKKAATEGLTTNHWGTHIFPPRRNRFEKKHAEVIEKLTDNPEKLVIEYNELLLKLTGQKDW